MDHNKPPQLPTVKTLDFLMLLEHWAKWVVHAWAGVIHAFTRRNFGKKYFNLCVWSGLPILWLWAVTTVPPDETGPHSGMTFVFIVLAIWHSLVGKDSIKGMPVHTRYNGYPRICDLLPLIPQQVAKVGVEPVLIGLAAYGVSFWSPSLAGFIGVGALMVLLDHGMIVDRYLARARQLRDAEIEHQAMLEMYDQHFNDEGL